MKVMTSGVMLLAAIFVRQSMFAFDPDLPEPQAQTPGPPPPGLVVPIDSNLLFLMIGGILLGVFFIISRKRCLP